MRKASTTATRSVVCRLFHCSLWSSLERLAFFLLLLEAAQRAILLKIDGISIFFPSFLPMMSHSLDHQSEWFSVFCSTVGKANTKRRRRHFRNIYKWRRSKKHTANNRTLLNSPSWDPSPRRTVAFTLQLSSSLRTKCVFEARSNNVSCHIFGRRVFSIWSFH